MRQSLYQTTMPLFYPRNVTLEFHFTQDFFIHSEIRFALTKPEVIYAKQALKLWRTGHFDDGADKGIPSIIFSNGNDSFSVTLTVVRKSLNLTNHGSYDIICW